MKIQTKVIWLLSAIVAVFASFLILYGYSEVKWMDALFENRVIEQKRFFDELVELKGASFKAHVTDYTFWDEMVSFVKSGDKVWAAKNIEPSLDAFKDNAVWIYKPDFSLVYSYNNIGANDLTVLPVTAPEIQALFAKGKFANFFINTSRGLMEIRGATIHPTRDYERKTPVQGYFFAGLLWDRNYVNDYPRILDGTLDLLPPGKADIREREKELPFGTVSFTKRLDGWDGNPVSTAFVTSKSVALRELYHSFRSQFVIFVVFSVAVTGILLFFLLKWVNLPLRRISDCLSEEDAEPIRDLQKESTEYGHIARLVGKFFEQKESLENEISERKQAEDKLRKLTADLEQWSRNLEDKVRERSAELQKSQERLVHSEKLAIVGQLASSVSHELRSPLTGIKNAAYLLKMYGADKDAKQAEAISIIDKEVDACTQVIGNMLGFVKPKEPVKKDLHIEDVVKESLKLSVIPSNIRVATRFKDDMAMLRADPVEMRQVFDNIIKNAIEAMATGGDLWIATYVTDGQAVVEFKDNGIGIASENLRRIFDPLFSTFPKGTGLGLTICRQIVEAHGGFIDVESEIGRGTTFRVRLPLK